MDLAVAAASKAFREGAWSEMIPQERARLMRRLADLCQERGPQMAALETMDNGKLVTEQALQWALIGELLHYWAGMADKLNGQVIASPIPVSVKNLPLPECFAYTRREPIGVVAAITPWNSPSLLLSFKFGPAIAAGCTMVVKPSEHTPVSTLEFAKLVQEAGFPEGVFNVVTSSRRSTGAALVAHKDVAKIAFTGSSATGREIAKSAAEHFAPTTSELGGKSASIVFADADLEKAVKGVASGIFAAAGQTCMASSRVLVEDAVHDAFVEALSRVAASMKMGDPLDPETQLGPISNGPNFDKVTGYLELGPREGARLVYGGKPSEELGGYFVEPTVFADVTNDMRVAREEIFGPVASVIRFKTEEEAISIANDTEYGLAGAVFTENVAKAHRVAHKVRAGTMWINTYRLVTHMVPFGGYGASGWGREGAQRGSTATYRPRPFG